MASKRRDLPNGRWVEQRSDGKWLFYDGPGRLIFVGNDEGLLKVLENYYPQASHTPSREAQ